MSGKLWRVWRRNFDSFRKYLHVNVLGNLGEPFLYLVAMGYGLGSFLGDVDGVSYVRFLAPGIVVSSAMFAAAYECTYMSFLKMVHLKTYDAIIVTPVGIEDVVAGDIAWGATKSLMSGTAMFAVAAALGLVESWWALLVPLLALLVGFHFASLSMLVTSVSPNFDSFSYFFELFVTPLFFFSGIFFPLDPFPAWIRIASRLSPITHAVDLSRALMLGRPAPTPLASVAVLAVTAAVLFRWSIARMRRRLIR
ncbi:MAG: ABC transporter permease [bacterium]|nr:ABC transporter permease [bacterium]